MPPKKATKARPKKQSQKSASVKAERIVPLIETTTLPVPTSKVTPPSRTAICIPIYLIYVVCLTGQRNIANTMIRKSYESLPVALDTLVKEYKMWAVEGEEGRPGLYPICHTEEQLSMKYLEYRWDLSRRENTIIPEGHQAPLNPGPGKIELALIHRDDKHLDISIQRRCVVVLQQIAMETR